MDNHFFQNAKNCKSIFNHLINPLISRCENLKILSNDLPYCFLQPTIIQWKIFLSKYQKIADPFSIPELIPLYEFSKNCNLPEMMYSIVLYNHVKKEKVVRAILEISPKTPYFNTKIFFRKTAV